MKRILIPWVVVGVISLAALTAQEPASNVELTGEDVEKVVEYLNAGIKQSKNGKLKKEFKDLLTLLEKPDSKEKVDLRSFPLIQSDKPVEGQVGVVEQFPRVFITTSTGQARRLPNVPHDVQIEQVLSDDEMIVSVFGNKLKVCASTKGLVDGQRPKDGLPGVYVVTETWRYKTALGGSNTIWVLKPFDIEKAAVVLKESREQPAGKIAKKPAAKDAEQPDANNEKKPASKPPAKH